jgi:hypothetical protein
LGGVVPNSIVWADWRSHYFGLVKPVASALGGFVIVMLAIRYVAMTSLYAYFMQSSSKEQAGTDFTILVCFELLVYFIGGAASGFLAKSLGYGNFYVVLAVASVVSVLLSQYIIARHQKTQQKLLNQEI